MTEGTTPLSFIGVVMTLEQLAVKVLSKLGVYDRSSLAAEDQVNVTGAYAGVYAQLLDDGLVTWALDNLDIPDRFSLSLTTLIAAEIGDFYNARPPAEGWEKAKQNATNTIRRQLATGQATETVKVEYY